MEKSPLYKVQVIVFAAVGVLLVALLMLTGTMHNIEDNSRPDGDYAVVEDVSLEKVENPDAPTGTVYEYRFTLGEVGHAETLAFYSSHHNIEVYLDGESIYSQSAPEGLIRTTGCTWTMIPLYAQDAGKEVRIVLTPVYRNYQDQDVAFLLGSELAIYKAQLWQAMPELILSLLVVLAGLVLLGAAIYNTVKKGHGLNFYALGMLAVSIGLWRFTDTVFSPFILEEYSTFLFYVSVVMLMICAIPMICLIKKPEKKRSRMVLELCSVLYGIVCIVQLLLQLTGALDLREMLTVTHMMILVSALFLLVSGIWERVKYPRKKGGHRNSAWLIGIGALLDLVIYYVRGISSGLLFVLISILCYVMSEGVQLVFAFIKQKQMLGEMETQLTLSRTTTMMSQIRSHFVFNVLNAISGMCKYDPQKADDTIVRFSRYLRNNIDIMEDDKPIPFTTDLRQLEDYVILEQVRFGDKIEFFTDIEADQFMIPPLILQPVVENAIKHGLSKKQTDGTIILRTREVGENIIITVEDDGLGFDIKELEKEKSVGIKNIRFRLRYLVHGALDIESEIGRGTKATIIIPKKEAEKCE